MQGQHSPHHAPRPEQTYAFLLDFGGPSPTGGGTGQGVCPPYMLPLLQGSDGPADASLRADRDATALTIVAVDADDAVSLPVYRVVHRRVWVGTDHRTLYGQIVALAEAWDPAAVVADATGVGAGLTDLLRSRLGERVIPVVFTAARKSDIGWRFMAACDAGRFRDHAPGGGDEARLASALDVLQRIFWAQVEAAEVEYLPGPGQRIRWGVPESAGHDDLLVSAALSVMLDEAEWGTGGSVLVPCRPADG